MWNQLMLSLISFVFLLLTRSGTGELYFLRLILFCFCHLLLIIQQMHTGRLKRCLRQSHAVNDLQLSTNFNFSMLFGMKE